jgi:hypothetical protein
MALGKKRFAEDDPLRQLHVPPWKRKKEDVGPASDALTEGHNAADDYIDRDEVRSHDEVVSEEDLL